MTPEDRDLTEAELKVKEKKPMARLFSTRHPNNPKNPSGTPIASSTSPSPLR